MTTAARGRLRPPSDAPAEGERSEQIARLGGVVVEQILSGTLSAPEDYDQDHDEWVVLVSGGATLIVGDERLDLVAGDWVLLHAPRAAPGDADGRGDELDRPPRRPPSCRLRAELARQLTHSSAP